MSTVKFSKNTCNVFFHILTKCNLQCSHCYINPKQHGTQILSPEQIEKWLDALATKASDVNLILLGGEPTLHTELAQIIKMAKKKEYRSITVDTNGYLFNDILNKVSPDELDYISFSLDGPDSETNDKIRGKGSFDICVKSIFEASKKGFKTSLIYTVSMQNFFQLPKMIDLLKKLPIDKFFIQVIGIRGKSKEAQDKGEDLQLSFDMWQGTIADIAQKIADEIKISVIYPKVFLKDDEPFYCAANVSKNYFIFPNGKVFQCPLCEDYQLNSLYFKDDKLCSNEEFNESFLFKLNIEEGCVMNKMLQDKNIVYDENMRPQNKIACCMLKEEIKP